MLQFQYHIVVVADKILSLKLMFSYLFHSLIKYTLPWSIPCFLLIQKFILKFDSVPIWLSSVLKKKMPCTHKSACQLQSSVAETESKGSMFDFSWCFQNKFQLRSKKLVWFPLFSASAHLPSLFLLPHLLPCLVFLGYFSF